MTLRSDDHIEFRLEGTQQKCNASIADLYRHTQQLDSPVVIPSRKRK